MSPAKRNASRNSTSVDTAESLDREVTTPAEIDASANTASIEHENGSDLQDRIRRRAYELYLARSGSDGCELDDWLAAEREVLPSASAERPAPRLMDGIDRREESLGG